MTRYITRAAVAAAAPTLNSERNMDFLVDTSISLQNSLQFSICSSDSNSLL